MKLMERMYHDLHSYFKGMKENGTNKKNAYKCSKIYKESLKRECIYVVQQSMLNNIQKKEKNEELKSLFFSLYQVLSTNFDELHLYIVKSSYENPLEFNQKVKQYRQICRLNIKAVIDVINVYYEDIKEASEENDVVVNMQVGIADISAKSNYSIMAEDLQYGSKKEKLLANIKALKIIKGKSDYSISDQKDLVKYSGWGGLPEIFNEHEKKFEVERNSLKSILTEKEYGYCKAGTLSEHFTPFPVIEFIYKVLEKKGFKGGKILDPAVGTGNFIGLIPKKWSCNTTAIDINPINAKIASALYPKTIVTESPFEKTDLDTDFDLIVTNVPFGNYQVYDAKLGKKYLIHDYFILKSFDLLKDNGLLAVITTKGTLDKKSDNVRKIIAEKGCSLELAVRLPNTAFKATANTEVVADILFFRKTEQGLNEAYQNVKTFDEDIEINEYFINHPDHVLGEIKKEIGLYGIMNTTVINNGDWLTNLNLILDNIQDFKLPKELSKPAAEQEKSVPKIIDSVIIDIPNDLMVKEYGYCIVDNHIYQREGKQLHIKELKGKKLERLTSMIKLKEYSLKLIDFMLTDALDEDVALKRVNFNKLYDRFVKNHGFINNKVNKSLIREDPDFPLLLSLEEKDNSKENSFKKADLFSKRTIQKETVIDFVESANDALLVSLDRKATVDIEFMMKLSRLDKETMLRDLRGILFKVPGTDQYVIESEYLSGDVKTKLIVAKTLAGNDKSLSANVEALTKVIPKDLEAHEIGFKLGSSWIPTDMYQEFISHLLKMSKDYITVTYVNDISLFSIAVNRFVDRTISTKVYGTNRIAAVEILNQTINQKDVKIMDKDYVADKYVLNKKETIIARQKQEEVKDLFHEWLLKDISRREKVTEIYNEKFNRYRSREFKKRILTFPGMNKNITLRPHQPEAVERIVFVGNTLLGHCVGSGKTFTMICAGMKLKQLKLAKKPIYVVPNHLIEDWATEFVRLYPTAKILAATKNDFTPLNRKRLFSRIATGDWDAVIVAHSSFKKLSISSEYIQDKIQKEIFALEDTIYNVNKTERHSNSIVKKLEAAKKRLEAELEKQSNLKIKDDTLSFEQLGIDYIFLDEAHEFKNLFVNTRQNVSGIPQTRSQKAFDMFMKTQYVTETFGQRRKGLVFATGTPISNSMVELYTLQRYLQMEKLEEMNLDAFDAWSSTFGESVTALEVSPDGSGFRMHTRFSKFVNLPELMIMVKMFADIRTSNDIDLPVPERIDHVIECEATPELQEFIDILVERSERIHNGGVDPKIDNMLLITGEGRKASLDLRLLLDEAEVTNDFKVRKVINNVFNLWEETKKDKFVQLIFCDLSTPSKRFNVYDATRNGLVEKGIPKEEISFIHEANTDQQKSELYKKVRSGEIRVLMGSTAKMGAGMNVQDLLLALHHLDCPWRPSDLEQREGRIIRQGNLLYSMNKAAHIFRYVTKGSFDAYSWQTIETKAKFISQIMRGDVNLRSTEDVDNAALSYSEIKAIASGNPLIMEKTKVDSELQKMDLLYGNYLRNQYSMERQQESIPVEIEKTKENIRIMSLDLGFVKPLDEFMMIINKTKVYDYNAAGALLLNELERIDYSDTMEITTYRGFKISLIKSIFESTILLSSPKGSKYTCKTTKVPANNISRINDVIESIADLRNDSEKRVSLLETNLAVIKKEIVEPFQYEEKLDNLKLRKKEIDRIIGATDKIVMDDDEKEVITK